MKTKVIGYPECERMSAVADDSHKLGDFLDWLNEQGIHLAEYLRAVECEAESWSFKLDRPKWRCVKGRLIAWDDEDIGECENCNGTGMAELREPRLIPRQERYEELLARYFKIDLNKVEDERRAMLDAMREANA